MKLAQLFVISLIFALCMCHENPPTKEPLMGGYETLPVSEAKGLSTYVVAKQAQLSGLELIKYERQVVNGFNHKLTYKGKKGPIEVVVYESFGEGGYSHPVINPKNVEEM